MKFFLLLLFISLLSFGCTTIHKNIDKSPIITAVPTISPAVVSTIHTAPKIICPQLTVSTAVKFLFYEVLKMIIVFIVGVVAGIAADRYVVPKVIEKYNEIKDKYIKAD